MTALATSTEQRVVLAIDSVVAREGVELGFALGRLCTVKESPYSWIHDDVEACRFPSFRLGCVDIPLGS